MTQIKCFSIFFRMITAEMTCSTYVDYSAKRPCPMYNIEDCSTPEVPILCAVMENIPRSPCTRYICSAEDSTSTNSPKSSTEAGPNLLPFGSFSSSTVLPQNLEPQVIFNCLHKTVCVGWGVSTMVCFQCGILVINNEKV